MRDLSKVFKALSDVNRIRILKMLEVRPLCVCEITNVLELATSTVSKHLSILRDAGFIMDEKAGKWVNYRLNQSRTDTYAGQLMPLLASWLPGDERVLEDVEKVCSVDRDTICGA
ncbi:MAG: metalloregulator ArsR/SmtB family transcription factor [Deltaproteobacteria bacterium]|nr:metalloregulator ArsR/SmtB family transcription factor [Deltaproteobacteria bacterium]